uniref:Uncharacterized protein n=1 Tax=Panagrolaimus sp. JU765 TaxID=591449 RepID=A0AC34R5S2_9BILA
MSNGHGHGHGTFPLPQPPSIPPPNITNSISSTNSSQHGYYSSSTSSIGRHNQSSNLPLRSGSFKSTNGQSFDDDDDDGFYDNINVDHDNRRYMDLDNASLNSHKLPPKQYKNPGKLGQLIRKIGGHGKPPTNSSSLSLNKMGIDNIGHVPLMKSNSLSGEPWRQHAIDSHDKSYNNLGQKLKQSIFGSKKRIF